MTAPSPPLPHPPRVLVLGIGNASRGDDAVGLVVAWRLQEHPLDGVTIMLTSGEGTALLALWQGTDAVVLVDAVCTGARPGTLHRFAVGTQPLPAMFSRVSTHAFGVAEAIELARALRQLPAALVVYGVEGAIFAMGAGLSAAVAAVVPQAIAQVRQEVLALTASSIPHGPPQEGQAGIERRSSNQSESRYGQTPSPSLGEARGGSESRRGSRCPTLPLPPIPTFPREGGRSST